MVVDQGIGISEEAQKKLFKPVTKLQHGKSLNPNGAGIGLSICKSILQKMNCDIAVVASTVVPMKG